MTIACLLARVIPPLYSMAGTSVRAIRPPSSPSSLHRHAVIRNRQSRDRCPCRDHIVAQRRGEGANPPLREPGSDTVSLVGPVLHGERSSSVFCRGGHPRAFLSLTLTQSHTHPHLMQSTPLSLRSPSIIGASKVASVVISGLLISDLTQAPRQSGTPR